MAATATAAKPKTKTATAVETTEVTGVIVDSGLKRLMVLWKKEDDKSGKNWMNIAKYVVDNEEISNKELKKALIDVRGLTEKSAKSEASRFIAIRKSEEAQELLEKALDGDDTITVYDLRSVKARSGQKASELTLEEILEKKFRTVAKFAIKEGLVEDAKDFGSQARAAYLAIEADAEKAAAAAEADSEDEVAEEEDEEETT